MKIYLAGGMRGYPYFNFPAFDTAKAELQLMGHEVFSPADNDRARFGWPGGYLPAEGEEEKLAERMGMDSLALRRMLMGDDYAWICANADAVCLMKGWELSSGAKGESGAALGLGLKRYIQTESAWLEIDAVGRMTGTRLI